MNRKQTLGILKTTTILAAALLLFEGCGASNGQNTSLNSNSLNVSVSQNSFSTCGSATTGLVRLGSEGGGTRTLSRSGSDTGGNRTIYSLTNACDALLIDISGQANGSDSVIVNIDGQEISIQVDAQGNFSALIAVDSVPQMISFTPVSGGFLGNAFNFDIANIALLQ